MIFSIGSNLNSKTEDSESMILMEEKKPFLVLYGMERMQFMISESLMFLF